MLSETNIPDCDLKRAGLGRLLFKRLSKCFGGDRFLFSGFEDVNEWLFFLLVRADKESYRMN